jgi:hypothetical protein
MNYLFFIFCSLFLGICNNTIDEQLNNNTLTKPHVIMRFAVFKEQATSENPNIIFAINNGLYLIPIESRKMNFV